MKCSACQYPLWDLKPGACPECGEHFDPTEHRFKVGAVRFCCPHCDQAYFGDADDGHLNPRSFDCVGCGRAIEESDCIVRPREDGSYEDQTAPCLSPWHDAERSAWKRFWGTVWLSMIRPGELGRGLPSDAKLGGALLFFLLVNTLAMVLGIGPFVLVIALLPLITGNPGGFPAGTGMMVLGTAVAWLPGMLLFFFIYGGIIHLVLKISGSTSGGLGRTLVSVGFGSGPNVVSGIPFVGYCLQTPAQIWSIVSTIILLSQSQAVSGLRATFAVLTPVILAILLYVGFIITMAVGTARIPAPPFNPPPLNLGPGQGNAAPAVQVHVAVDREVTDVRTLKIDTGPFLEAIANAAVLPSPSLLGDLPGVVLTTPLGVPIPAEVKYRGRGFEAWSIPGLFVVKVGDAAGYARMVSMGDLDATFEFETEEHDAGSLAVTSWVITETLDDAMHERPGGLHAKVVEQIDALGGSGRELDQKAFQKWMVDCHNIRLGTGRGK